MQVTLELGLYFVQLNGSNSALSPVVYGDIALSIKTQYNTITSNNQNIFFNIHHVCLQCTCAGYFSLYKFYVFLFKEIHVCFIFKAVLCRCSTAAVPVTNPTTLGSVAKVVEL